MNFIVLIWYNNVLQVSNEKRSYSKQLKQKNSMGYPEGSDCTLQHDQVPHKFKGNICKVYVGVKGLSLPSTV